MLHNHISSTKVFSISRFNKKFDQDYRLTVVVYGCLESENKRNLKLHNLVVGVYFKGERVGSSGYRPNKLINVSKKTKELEHDIVIELKNKAIQDAYRTILSRGQTFKATILYWCESRSNGMAVIKELDNQAIEIHGCNAINALTGYDETCCIQMGKNEEFECSLADMGTHLTIHNFKGKFDYEKSKKLNHSSLAFKKQNGKFINGLFS